MIAAVSKWLKLTAVAIMLSFVAITVAVTPNAYAEQASTAEESTVDTADGTPGAGTGAPAPSAGTTATSDCETGFLTFPAWFRGLVKIENGKCSLMSPTDVPAGGSGPIGISNYVWRIVLNVIEIALHLIGYLAVFFIIYGGFRFLTRGDNPSEVEAARKTIMNAVIGLVISIASIALVSFIFRIFG